MTKIKSSNLGYPRIGEKREWKRTLENYWNGNISQETLLAETKAIRLDNLRKQQTKGIDLIPVGEFSLYDHVLDTAVAFGLVPERYDYTVADGPVDIDTYYAIARGVDDAVAGEMTKWFNTNYHYIVPELNEAAPKLLENRALKYYEEAKNELGIDGKPVILGPITFVALSKGYDDFQATVNKFLPLYAEILTELAEAGVEWVQIDEPIFSTSIDEATVDFAKEVYAELVKATPSLKVILQTYFEKVTYYEKLITFPVAGFGLDFVHGDSLAQIKAHGFPEDKVLAAGIIDGRNVWRADLGKKVDFIETLKTLVEPEKLIIQPSSSLLHVPVTKQLEEKIDVVILGGLSFADEKLTEIVALVNGANVGRGSISEEIEAVDQALKALKDTYRSKTDVREAVAALTEADAVRQDDFKKRREIQRAHFKLPYLATTTIGSLPQTKEVRQTRTKWRKGELTDTEYKGFVKAQIARWIEIQEEIDLDVLVHGEFERNDMVEYFGEKLGGFSVTEYGWVQSYGSRCVKPPLIFGDVHWTHPMTVNESVFAQSLTGKYVKGMLTGPVTILNWSFVHDATPRTEIVKQIALALQKEIAALESNGIEIIQVDEPALREGLPLDQSKWEDYLKSSSNAFRLATAKVRNQTQIHTHMCYSNFEDIFDCIDDLDADVISIETSRGHGELVSAFEENTYQKEIGLGVYDIHSPRIPSTNEIKQNIYRALKTIPEDQFWVNPDCGLKTRKEHETIEALKVMVQAAKEIREEKLVLQK